MAHVHWWLVALAFVLGLVLTLTLMVRPVRAAVPAGAAAAGGSGRAPEPKMRSRPAKKVPGAKMAAGQGSARKGPRKGPPTNRIPARKGAPAKKVPGRKGPPVKKVPGTKGAVAKRLPAGKGSATKKASGATESAESPTKRIRVVPVSPAKAAEKWFAPYGPGSARAAADGGGPEGWLIKGRSDTRLFYKPDDTNYDTIDAQVWFQDEAAAARAFFTPWSKSSRKK